MPRDQRSPRPPITRKNPVGHSSGTLPLWLPLSLWERGLGGEVRGERNVSSPRTLPSPRRRASRRSDSAARRRGFSRQPPPAPKQPTDRSHHTITRHHPTTPQFFNFRHARLLSPSAPAPGTASHYHQQPPATISTFTTEQESVRHLLPGSGSGHATLDAATPASDTDGTCPGVSAL